MSFTRLKVTLSSASTYIVPSSRARSGNTERSAMNSLGIKERHVLVITNLRELSSRHVGPSLASFLSDWSLSPHLGQARLEPLVSRLDKRTTDSPTHRALYSICR